jgi:hypothetical protein
MLLNYRRDKLAVTPSVQFQGGAKYGAPETTPGIDPANPACVPLIGSHRYDAFNCPATLVIPDPFTGVFDDLGSFVQPNELMVNFQASYDVSSRLTLTAVLANIVNTCWGGTHEAWSYSDSNICSYQTVGNGLIPPVGNAYNPLGRGDEHPAVPAVSVRAVLGPVSGLGSQQLGEGTVPSLLRSEPQDLTYGAMLRAKTKRSISPG